MKQISEKTCIEFVKVDPQPGQDWLAIMRNGHVGKCHAGYIRRMPSHTYYQQSIKQKKWTKAHCGYGAFVEQLGTGSPNFLIISQMRVVDNERVIALFIHELLHVLGVGHIHLRQGRSASGFTSFQTLVLTKY